MLYYCTNRIAVVIVKQILGLGDAVHTRKLPTKLYGLNELFEQILVQDWDITFHSWQSYGGFMIVSKENEPGVNSCCQMMGL